MPDIDPQDAFSLFELPEGYTLEDLQARYQKLLHTWHPARYASLTNNPKKYMEMYKKGEAKTKDIHSAYQVLIDRLENTKEPSA